MQPVEEAAAMVFHFYNKVRGAVGAERQQGAHAPPPPPSAVSRTALGLFCVAIPIPALQSVEENVGRRYFRHRPDVPLSTKRVRSMRRHNVGAEAATFLEHRAQEVTQLVRVSPRLAHVIMRCRVAAVANAWLPPPTSPVVFFALRRPPPPYPPPLSGQAR